MIRHYDMASGEPLENDEAISDPLVEASSPAVEARLETLETGRTPPIERRGTIPAGLIQLDVEAFLSRQH